MIRLFRRSNRSLYADACRRKAVGIAVGPTPHQVRLQSAGEIDALFLDDYLIEDVHSSNAYSTAYFARHLPSGHVRLLRCYVNEFCLTAEAYRNLTHHVSEINSPLVAQLSDVFEHQGRLCVARPWIEGESLASIVSRKDSLSPKLAIEMSLILLGTLSKLSPAKLKGLRPSQIILDYEGTARLIDLDETELLLFRRKTPLRSTNMSPLSGRDRSFFAAEVTQGHVLGSTPAMLYSVGRLLGYMVTGDWRPSTQQKGLQESGTDGLDHLMQWLCGNPLPNTGTMNDAIAKLQLYLPSDSETITLPRVEIQAELAHPVQPPMMMTSLLRVAGVAVVTFVLLGLLSYQIVLRDAAGLAVVSEDRVEEVESFDEFKIP